MNVKKVNFTMDAALDAIKKADKSTTRNYVISLPFPLLNRFCRASAYCWPSIFFAEKIF
jgi:hypothetical protein